MGGWDYYCGICGVPLSTPYWDEEDASEDGNGYDPAIITSSDDARLAWLRQFRVVTEIPECYNKNAPEGWISGPASEEMYGDASLTFPEEDTHMTFDGQRWFNRNMYEGYSDDPFSVPFHDACHSLLLKYIGKERLDPDVFYEVTRLLCEEGSSSQLSALDYGEAAESMEQYWCTFRGAEWLVMSPLNVTEVEAIFNNPPRLDESAPSQLQLRSPSKRDPFSNFAPEIMMNIMSALNLHSIERFRLASRAACNIDLGNHFWKTKVVRDMPWLFDIPESVYNSTTVDWGRLYYKLHYGSRAGSKFVIRGLANRRRIWNKMLSQIAPCYLEALELRQAERDGQTESLANTRSTPSAVLVEPEPNDSRSSVVALLQKTTSVASARIDVAVCFNQQGEISDIKIPQMEGRVLKPDAGEPHRMEKIAIPEELWITGFLFTTRGESRRPVGVQVLLTDGERRFGDTGEGGKRLVHAPLHQFVVGIRLHTSKKEDLLCRVGLLCHQEWRAGDHAQRRLWDHNRHFDDLYSLPTTKYLWHNELPAPRLEASEPQSGDWSHDLHVETSPFEALHFPKHHFQIKDVTAIAADVQFGGFEIRFGSEPTRAIGPKRHAMKVLEIDGKGGERIVSVHASVHHIPKSIRIVTNRSRQLVIGQPDSREKPLPDVWNEGDRHPIYGIYGYWKNRDSEKASMDAVGTLFDPGLWLDPGAEKSPQVWSLLWEPEAPTSDVEASGPIIGSWSKAHTITSPERAVPDDCCLWSWLDFSRPVSSVRTSLCHSLDTNELPLVGIELSYAAGKQEKASIGPSEFHPPTGQGSTPSGQHWCFCQFAGAKITKELEQQPHYQHHEWSVGGKHLSTLRIFLATPKRQSSEKPMDGAKGRAVTAIQFVDEEGTESPVWSYCGYEGAHEEIQEIKLGKANGEAAGVKFFAGRNGRSVTREDYVVQAFQAMVKSSDQSKTAATCVQI